MNSVYAHIKVLDQRGTCKESTSVWERKIRLLLPSRKNLFQLLVGLWWNITSLFTKYPVPKNNSKKTVSQCFRWFGNCRIIIIWPWKLAGGHGNTTTLWTMWSNFWTPQSSQYSVTLKDTRRLGEVHCSSRGHCDQPQTRHHHLGQSEQQIPHLWAHCATWCEHRPTEHRQIKQICTLCHRHHTHHNNSDGLWLAIFLQTTRNAWLLSTKFASQASSSQCLWKTSQAWASTPRTTSGCAETIRSSSSHLFFLHHSSPFPVLVGKKRAYNRLWMLVSF